MLHLPSLMPQTRDASVTARRGWARRRRGLQMGWAVAGRRPLAFAAVVNSLTVGFSRWQALLWRQIKFRSYAGSRWVRLIL